MPIAISPESSPPRVMSSLANFKTPTKAIQQEKVRYGDLRQTAFWVLSDVLHLLRTRRWKISYSVKSTFERERELPYFEAADVKSVEDAVREALEEIIPEEKDLQVRGVKLVRALNCAESCIALLDALDQVKDFYQEIHDLMIQGAVEPFFAPVHSTQMMSLSTKGDQYHGWTAISWPVDFGSNLVEAVQSNVRWIRQQSRNPTFTEFIFEHVAYCFLASGKQLHSLSFANSAQFLGTVGFRPVSQTYPSLTDPGDGHVFGTTRKEEWMNGAIIHVEHLERPGGVPRSLIESYRIPAILDFARVRLHTAGAMPNTYFTGRALRDSKGSFDHSFIKVVNTTSAACSQAFSLGAAECKIAMDELSTSQMIAYLTALSGHTLREPHQYLSCAFNLNWPIVDDIRQDEHGNVLPPQLITDPFEIAQLAIKVATAGGFDKVTWDGASDSYPSKCIIFQLSFEKWLYLAHRAHECGLTTYTSAGFKFPQISYGVWAGIDGLGIGGAQILRHMDHNSGMHGPFTEENLDRILEVRNAAAEHVRGRGAALLARMDRMFFEGSLTQAEDDLRQQLFQVLADVDENGIEKLLANEILDEIRAMTDDGQRPYTAWAQRLLRGISSGQKVLLQRFATQQEWDTLVTQLALALDQCAPVHSILEPVAAKMASRDIEDEIYDVHLGRTWTQLRRRRADELSGGFALSRHDDVVKVKTTPFSSNAASRRASRRTSAVTSAAGSPRVSRRPSLAGLGASHSSSP
ncbi:Hypothetical protein R9X50_00098900 [Acrodontium crateriforme]|uniref:Uncharacterized protein n=1 Tax=Acrodontium crateriforme TaxID=150365 RepID=A0AAQ3LYX3_9PEZI|nr:Hypothetical protein R9X50_00098900 [Acrodontium crateriforme]